jgi:hypothetical protein
MAKRQPRPPPQVGPSPCTDVRLTTPRQWLRAEFTAAADAAAAKARAQQPPEPNPWSEEVVDVAESSDDETVNPAYAARQDHLAIVLSEPREEVPRFPLEHAIEEVRPPHPQPTMPSGRPCPPLPHGEAYPTPSVVTFPPQAMEEWIERGYRTTARIQDYNAEDCTDCIVYCTALY